MPKANTRASTIHPTLKQSGFPPHHYLNITTQNHVLCWDAQNVAPIFRSKAGGILAAKQLKDGTGQLAIADSQIVLLHDCRRGSSKAHRLKGANDHVRLLEYSKDSKTLFFTTSLQNAVQRYSINESRILDPTHSHPSPPTILAVSSTSHLLVSASADPPVIYLQNLTHGTSPLQLHPTASDTAVAVAAFHPERANIFLLGFTDGTIAAYDATTVFRDDSTKVSAEMAKSGRMGEISHLKGLHRVVTRQGILDSAMSQQGVPGAPHVGSRSESITAAAFMPGHKTRAVSVGIDGKCRLIDFERGVTILRTWKTGAPATCLSVLSSKSSPRARGNTQIDRPIEPKTRSRAGAQDHVPMSEAIQTDNVLAVGRVDGKVMLFDSIGCLMTEKDADPHGGRVIDVVWIKGSAPKSSYDACDNSGVLGQRIDIPELEDWKAVERNVRPHQRAATSTGNKRKLSELIPVADDTLGQGQEADGKHLLKSPTASKEATAPTSKYMDLFSPVKNMSYHSPERNVAEPVTKPRTRSVTFHESKPDIPLSGSTSYSTALICSPQKNESSGLPEPVISASHNDGRTASIQLDTARQSLMHGAKSFRRIPESTKDGSSLCSSRSIHSDSSTKSSDCSNILADLKRAGGHDSNKGNGIALFAPYMKPVPKPAVREGKGKGRENPLRYPIDGAIDDDAKLNITSAESSSNNSPQNSTFNPDIWLDSASPVKFARPRRRARPSHSKLRQAVSFPHPSTQSQLPHPPDPNSPTSPLLHQRTFSPSIDSDICAGAGDLHDEDNEARFGTALGCQNAIEYGSTSPRRSSLSQVKELLSPRRRRDRAGAKEQAKEVEAGNKVEMGKSRAGTLEIEEQREEREEEMEETVGAGMGDRKRVGRLALGDITGNEIPRLEEEEATGLKTEAGKRRDSLGEKIGIQAFGSKGRGRAGKKPIKGKTNEVQPEHRCHCTECPALRRELQELRDEITQLRQEILIRKKNGY